ncbi:DegT/DnrJ/EryC1/StrS family aminotransferase [Janthinobacterium sp.]|uniref:DegT/DnrJ/EryC1/StrS family aminotransferase n=1 Tax=Janthinobacterium sp. TaxID=1871054 RepID=UPI00293D5B11|nr:DegT/DnrJ/EryC1/StrS family aminotransferase [Janthinobacterium sp.]
MPHSPALPLPRGPVLSLAAFAGARRGGAPSILALDGLAYTTSARAGIGNALRLLGVGAGDEVLIPAYHCAAMVEPALWLGARPVFFRLRADLGVDLADIAAKLGPRSKALLVPHYFGFPQDMTRIRAFCERRGLALIEDCAHALFGSHAGQPLGSFGDFAVASPWKFLPLHDGGCLRARDPRHRPALRHGGLPFQLKAGLNLLEHAFAHGRLGGLRRALAPALALKDALWRRAKAGGMAGAANGAPDSAAGGEQFEAAWVDTRMSLVSRLLLARLGLRRVIELRRSNYLRLEQACRDLPGCSPLFAALPDGVVPYVFALRVAAAAAPAAAAELNRRGVPVIRFGERLWPGVDAATCAVAAELSHCLLQFPIHQELTPSELARMSAEIGRVFRP